MYPVSVFGGFFLRPQEHCSVVIRCCLSWSACWKIGQQVIPLSGTRTHPSIGRSMYIGGKRYVFAGGPRCQRVYLTLRQGGGCEGHGGLVGSGNWRCGAGDDAANRVSHYSHPTELDALPEVLLGAFVANSWLKIILETLMN